MHMKLLTIYTPDSHAKIIKEAAFNAEAGNIGSYTCCAWQTQGMGQFMPGDNSKPYVGTPNSIQYEPEVKIELLVKSENIPNVITAIKAAHPYETPVYYLVEVEL